MTITWQLLDDLTGEWNPPPEYRTAAEVKAYVRGVSDVIRLVKRLQEDATRRAGPAV